MNKNTPDYCSATNCRYCSIKHTIEQSELNRIKYCKYCPFNTKEEKIINGN